MNVHPSGALGVALDLTKIPPLTKAQIVRDWLTSPASGWDRGSGAAPPPLPDAVVERTRARYVEVFERLTGQQFQP